MIKRNDFDFFSTYLIAKEAQRRDIKVSKLLPNTKKSLILLDYKGRQETIVGQKFGKMPSLSITICRNKELTRQYLKKGGVKTTEGALFTADDINNALEYAESVGYPVVLKPDSGTWGRDVFLNITSRGGLRKKIKQLIRTKKEYLVEKQFPGNEYRITASRKKLFGIINRVPANVIGNGKDNIKKLIEIKNSDPRRGIGHEKALVRINIDSHVLEMLDNQGLELKSVPENGRQIFLRNNSNLSTGGDSIDYTDIAHKNITKIALRTIKAIPGLPYAGFDLLTPDITKDPFKTDYAVIEINESPMISMHHFPYKGKKRDVAKELIDLLFPGSR